MANEIFVVVWTGGGKRPTYRPCLSREEALVIGNAYADRSKPGDQIDVVLIDIDTMVGVRIYDYTNTGEE